MSYEVEAISDSASPSPSQMPTMREERVLNPYEVKSPKIAQKIGQPDISRASLPEEPKAPEETVKLSPQVAALARREQKFRALQQQLEKDRAALAAEKEEIAQLRAMKEKLKAKDYSGLDGLVDYNEYSQYQVNKLNGVDPVSEEFKKLNGKISEIEKNAQENISRQFEAAVSERRNATKALIDQENSQFPRIKKAKAHEAVVQHILDTWEHDSQELSVEQAAKEVEEILVEKARQWSQLLEEEKKVDEVGDQKKQLPPLKPSLKTLTNQVTAGDLKRPQKSLHHMSDSERWAEARRRAEEKLQAR